MPAQLHWCFGVCSCPIVMFYNHLHSWYMKLSLREYVVHSSSLHLFISYKHLEKFTLLYSHHHPQLFYYKRMSIQNLQKKKRLTWNIETKLPFVIVSPGFVKFNNCDVTKFTHSREHSNVNTYNYMITIVIMYTCNHFLFYFIIFFPLWQLHFTLFWPNTRQIDMSWFILRVLLSPNCSSFSYWSVLSLTWAWQLFLL